MFPAPTELAILCSSGSILLLGSVRGRGGGMPSAFDLVRFRAGGFASSCEVSSS